MLQGAPSRRGVFGMVGYAGAATLLGLPAMSFAQTLGQRVNIVNTRGMGTITAQELMKRRRHLEQLGIEANIVYVADASKLMGSLLSGESDICMFSGIGAMLTAIEKGAKLKLVAGSLIKPEHAIYTKKPEIRTIKDLEGKTLGSGSSGALVHTMWIAILRKHGVDDKKVRFVNVGGTPDIFKATAAGVVDAGIAEIDVYDQQDKYGVRVIPEGKLWQELPQFTFQGAYASERAIKDKRDAIVRTLAAYARLYRFMASPQSEKDFVEAQLAAAGGRADPANARWQWKFFHETQIYATDLLLSEERVRYMQDLNLSLGVQKRIVPYSEVADMSLARDALKLAG